VTHHPVFVELTDLLEVDNWLCNLYAAQQLRGNMGVWSTIYTAALQDDHQVQWNEFHAMFHTHHIPVGLMHMQQEFLDLLQGPNNVYDYNKKFNYFAQYEAHHVDTDEKKAELVRNGLTAQLGECLVLFRDLTFNVLVSATIDQEGASHACMDVEERKRKRAMSGPSGGSSGGAPVKYRMVYTPP
jgi:hypothetical protein